MQYSIDRDIYQRDRIQDQMEEVIKPKSKSLLFLDLLYM